MEHFFFNVVVCLKDVDDMANSEDSVQISLLSFLAYTPELQIRGGIEDNSKIIFLFLNKNICCDPSLEPSQ